MMEPKEPNGEIPSTIIPPSSLQDTVALLFIFIACPHWISCMILSLYALSSSSRAIGGKIIAGILQGKNEHLTWSQFKPTSRKIKRMIIPCSLAIAVDCSIAILIIHFLPGTEKVTSILAKALIASTLVGSNKNSFSNALSSSLLIFLLDFAIKFLSNGLMNHSEVDLNIARLSFYKSPFDYRSAFSSKNNSVISMLFSYFNIITNFCFTVLSIHAILLGLSPVSKNIFILKSYAKTLDQLSNITPDISIKVSKNNHISHTSLNPLPLANNNHNTNNQNRDSSDVAQEVTSIYIPQEVSDTVVPACRIPQTTPPATFPSFTLSQDISSCSAVVALNFENFCISPFGGTSSSQRRANKRLAAVRTLQPFWSLLGAARAMFSKPEVYSGDPLETDMEPTPLNCFVSYIGETSVGLQFVNFQFKDLSIKVNDIVWYQAYDGISHYNDTYIVIHGLTPLSQYTIEVSDKVINKDKVMSSCTVCTTSNGNTLNQSQNTSPLFTLHQSLITINDSLAREKLSYKKTRKENNKKISLLKSDIDNLRSKISNFYSSDERITRKKVSLKTTVDQFEDEVKYLEKSNEVILEEEERTLEIFQKSKVKLESRISELTKFIDSYNDELEMLRKEIDSLESEKTTLDNKQTKLKSKREKITQELNRLVVELEALKKADLDIRHQKRLERSQARDSLIEEFAKEIIRIETEISKQIAETQSNGQHPDLHHITNLRYS